MNARTAGCTVLSAALLAAFGGGCAVTDEAGLTGSCIITATGNKLCGDDAKAWCDATDTFREGDSTLGIEPDYESQAACDGL